MTGQPTHPVCERWIGEAVATEDELAAEKAAARTQGRQADAEQVVSRDALRRGVQAGFRATGSIHQAEGRHQRLCCSVQSASDPPGQNQLVNLDKV
jgi:hypothetical protein